MAEEGRKEGRKEGKNSAFWDPKKKKKKKRRAFAEGMSLKTSGEVTQAGCVEFNSEADLI